MAETLTLAPVAALLGLLDAAGIRVAQDPGDLTPPGVLVQLTGFTRSNMGAAMVPTVRVFAVVPDGNHAKVSRALVTLTNKLLELVDPDGDVSATAVALPSTPGVALPALAFPLHLY